MSRKLKILVVEDDPDNLDMLRVILEAEEHDIVACTCAAEALDACRDGRADFDLLLVDLYLPDIDGLELIEQIRAHPRIAGVQAICISASARGSDEQRARAAGADAFLAKPFRRSELLGRIARLLG